MRAQVRRKGGALRLGGLAGFVLGPAVELGLAKLVVRALLICGNDVDRIPAAIVIVDACGKAAIVITVAVCRDMARQTQADIAFGCGVTQAKTGDRKDEI